MSESSMDRVINTDILVVGGGLNGLPLAIAVASAGLDVVVLEREDPSTVTDAGFDGRVSAIAHASRNLLRTIGVWDHIRHAEPMLDIRITDGPSKLFLHYDHRQLGDEPFGHMVENRHMRQALLKRVSEIDSLNLMAPASYTSIERDANGATALLDDGTEIRAKLVVAADGRLSQLR
ncbi:MAG: FAD-dependent monooxygenase, partial [Sneathiella sp.]|nr:FAD-dependent monooxygenase [Sneathiella sp.]